MRANFRDEMTFVEVSAKKKQTHAPKKLFLEAFWSIDFVFFAETCMNVILS